MERFDIALFNQNQHDGEYTRELTDGTVIQQFVIGDGYGEKTLPPKAWFYGYKEFHPNGMLQLKGQSFVSGDFEAGEWIECDESGAVTSKTNHDKPYKLDVFAIMEIIKARKIPFSREKSSDKITRKVVNGRATWFVRWKEQMSRIETLTIDDATAKIIKQSFYKFRESN